MRQKNQERVQGLPYQLEDKLTLGPTAIFCEKQESKPLGNPRARRVHNVPFTTVGHLRRYKTEHLLVRYFYRTCREQRLHQPFHRRKAFSRPPCKLQVASQQPPTAHFAGRLLAIHSKFIPLIFIRSRGSSPPLVSHSSPPPPMHGTMTGSNV